MHRWICMLLLVFGSCSRTEKAPVDHRVARRIVSLSPSTTELLFVLGAIDTLVGRDKYSVEPPSIRSLPVLGDFLTPNVEAIAALEPDLVLLDISQARAADALAALDVRTLSLGMHQVQDVRDGLLAVGEILDRSAKASELLSAMDAQIAVHASRARQAATHPRVLLIIDRSPESLRNMVAAGPKTYLDELLTIVGGTNMMAGSPVRYPQLSAEQILRAAPDIIIDLSKAGGGTEAYELVAEVPAAIHKRIHILDDRLLLSPTPRVGEALDKLAALLDMSGAL